MTPICLESVLSDENLFAAWSRVAENQGCAGVDGQTIADFEVNLHGNLGRLREEVRTGAYRALALLRAWLPREGGDPRPLSIPTVRDRVLQTAVALVVTPVFEAEFEDCSFAYRRGRSVDQAVRRVILLRNEGFQWVVDCDIQAFFDEIDHGILMAEIEKLVQDPGILGLIRQWLAAEVVDGDDRVQVEKGVPQGSPISPLLSNLYLDHLDETLLDNNLRLVRFADDFLVLCKSRDRARDALELTEQVLTNLRLRINADKTRIVDFNTGFRFLGVQFVRSLVFKPYDDEDAENWDSDSRGSWPEPKQPLAAEGHPPSDVAKTIARESRAIQPAAVCAAQSTLAMLPSEEISDFVPPVPDEDIPGTGDPRLRTLYLLSHGTVVGKESERFVVRKQGQIIEEIPAIKVDQIMVFGNSQITTQAMHFCLTENIPIYLLSGNGRYHGVVDSFSTDPVLLHRDQFLTASDPVFCLNLAREFVRGKIDNSRTFLIRLARRRHVPALVSGADDLKTIAGQLDGAASLDQLRGFEGIGARVYFGALAAVLEPQWRFAGRTRQPPTDPVNAMLSYGYTLLFHNIYSLQRARGLNPHVGYLHPLRAGHPALVSDLIEEFRAIVVDAVVFNLVLNGKIAASDFSLPNALDRSCWMSSDARAKLIRSLETKLNASITHPNSGLHLDYRRCIEHQVQELAAVIRGRRSRYRPMVVR